MGLLTAARRASTSWLPRVAVVLVVGLTVFAGLCIVAGLVEPSLGGDVGSWRWSAARLG